MYQSEVVVQLAQSCQYQLVLCTLLTACVCASRYGDCKKKRLFENRISVWSDAAQVLG